MFLWLLCFYLSVLCLLLASSRCERANSKTQEAQKNVAILVNDFREFVLERQAHFERHGIHLTVSGGLAIGLEFTWSESPSETTGATTTVTTAAAPVGSTCSRSRSIPEEFSLLQRLREQESLTEEEFMKAKAKVLLQDHDHDIESFSTCRYATSSRAAAMAIAQIVTPVEVLLSDHGYSEEGDEKRALVELV